MTGHQITAWEANRYDGALRGDDDAIYDAFRSVGAIYRWDRAQHAYLVTLRRFDDVLAALESAGHRVHYKPATLW